MFSLYWGQGRGRASCFGAHRKWFTISIITVGVSRRGRGPVPTFPVNPMLLLRLALLIALVVTMSLIIYGLNENSKEVFSPSLGIVSDT